MGEQIKELIEKIHQEGVAAAAEKAQEIEGQARQKSKEILRKADAQAREILNEAQVKIDCLQKSSQATLKQAGRDLLLTLKAEVLTYLERLITEDVSAALTPEALSEIISGIINKFCAKENNDAVIYLSDHDKKKLEGHFVNRLKGALKEGVELRQQADIHAGLVISFDAGKSQFDFSDKALAQYLVSYLKPRVAEIFEDAE